MRFCYLEKDEKTFKILSTYIKNIKKGVDLLSVDNKIQIEEIKKHNIAVKKEESIQWITMYGAGYRIYLNTIKEVAIIFVATERSITWENFCYFCDKINKIHDSILEKIFL